MRTQRSLVIPDVTLRLGHTANVAENPEPATHGFSVRCKQDITPAFTDTYSVRQSELTPEIQARGVTEPSPDLAEIVAAWPKMPEHIKAAVLALVRTGGTKDRE
jgi:hypothetical protein